MRLALVVLIGACGFPALPKLGGGDDAPAIHDAPVDSEIIPDAGACTAASATCATSGLLRTCASAGANPVDTPCAWGCITPGGMARCGKLAPTGGAVIANDAETTTLSQLADLVLSNTTINGNDGSIPNFRAAGGGVVSGIDYRLSASGVAIFRVKSFRVTGQITLGGTHPIAIVADTSISIESTINASGTCNIPLAVAGGGDGGQQAMPGGGGQTGGAPGNNQNGAGGG
ncbi:MAG: hypothetical protein JO257_22390, partial [Deltaproteobacteria bacterium]|nr:hypothetical protein [Deltaproteobacteria bacterium]